MTRLADAVRALLAATEGLLESSEHEPIATTPTTVSGLLRAGEEGVAYEILCDNLYEIDARPDRRLVEEVREAAKAVGLDPGRAEFTRDEGARTNDA